MSTVYIVLHLSDILCLNVSTINFSAFCFQNMHRLYAFLNIYITKFLNIGPTVGILSLRTFYQLQFINQVQKPLICLYVTKFALMSDVMIYNIQWSNHCSKCFIIIPRASTAEHFKNPFRDPVKAMNF